MTGVHKLTIPKLGLTMEEGTLVKWLVDVGTQVEPGNEVAEVETDKIANAVEASQSGVFRRKVANEGDLLPVGALIGVLADPSVSEAEIDAFIAAESCAPACGELAEVADATPAEPSNAAPSAALEGDEVHPLSSMRTVIAKTVVTSWTTIPHIFVNVKIDMGKAESLYRGLKETGVKVSINDVVVKALATVVPAFPLVNASFADKSILVHPDVNVSLAVGLDEGVVMPVIRQCQRLSVEQIGEKSKELVARAQGGALTQEDLSGGTVSISNMGMLGTDKFTAIVPPGQVIILAVGMIESVPVVKDGIIVVARVMQITMSADHRVVDGAYGAKFLNQLKKTLEAPEGLFG
jgi:pyruvate dehydrogenase E2 component (dihydrolipoamide acetyltransferase)